jgi:hypothetical protein
MSEAADTKQETQPRKGMPEVKLGEEEFKRRFRWQFQDPAFEAVGAELARIAEVAWDGYRESRKSPRTRKAGPEFSDPDYDLSTDWLAARTAIAEAGRKSSAQTTESRSRCSTCRVSPRNTDAISIPAKRASRRPRRSAIGPAPATRTIRSDKRRTG